MGLVVVGRGSELSLLAECFGEDDTLLKHEDLEVLRLAGHSLGQRHINAHQRAVHQQLALSSNLPLKMKKTKFTT